MTVESGFVPQPAADVLTAYLDGEAVVYQPTSGRPMLLNPSASAVWMMLDGESALDAVTSSLAEIFAVDAPVISGDVASAVERFGELGLLANVEPLGPDDATPLLSGGVLAGLPVP